MSEITEQTQKGLKWTAVGAGTQIVVQLILMLFLSRWLGKEVYGEAVVGMLVIRILQPFSVAGIGMVLIQEKDLSKKQLSSLFWSNLGFALVIYGLIFSFADILATNLGFPKMVAFLQIGGFVVIINAFGNISNALLISNLYFEKTNKIIFLATILELIVAISITLLGKGKWSLLASSMSRVVLVTVLNMYIAKDLFLPYFYFEIEEIKPILYKCFYNMIAQMVNMLSVNIDNFL